MRPIFFATLLAACGPVDPPLLVGTDPDPVPARLCAEHYYCTPHGDMGSVDVVHRQIDCREIVIATCTPPRWCADLLPPTHTQWLEPDPCIDPRDPKWARDLGWTPRDGGAR